MSGVPALRRRPDISVPHQCRELIEHGALVAISSSGGKDSQAMTILLSRIVPREQLLVVHAPLGESEWQGTLAHVENTMPPGVPLILARVASGKSLLERVEERGQWPDPARRWCTGDHKRTPIERELRRFLKAHSRFEGRLVSAIGLRCDESAARGPNACPGNATTATAERVGNSSTGCPSSRSPRRMYSASSPRPARSPTGSTRKASAGALARSAYSDHAPTCAGPPSSGPAST